MGSRGGARQTVEERVLLGSLDVEDAILHCRGGLAASPPLGYMFKVAGVVQLAPTPPLRR
jgi:hypothetical protein